MSVVLEYATCMPGERRCVRWPQVSGEVAGLDDG